MIDKTFAERVKALCKAKKWTSADLAEQIGVSRRTVERWRYGRKPSEMAVRAVEQLEK
jgi:transcriptional regulator with XRE-family HTH domain